MKEFSPMIITKKQILAFEKYFRTNLINSLSGFKSINLIGTIDDNGIPNLSLINSVVHIGSNPPLIGYIQRPVSVSRHTYDNITESGCFTINHVNEAIYVQAHQCSARYPDGVSEFEATGLSPEFRDTVSAPYVKESLIKMGLELSEIVQIYSNQTLLIIGEIKEIILPKENLGKDGYLDIERAHSILGSGLDGYHKPQRLARLAYAKVGKPVKEIET